VPYLVQNGGNDWGTTFTLDKSGIVIHFDQLRSVDFSSDRTQMTVGGGALICDVVPAAAARNDLVLTRTCNCVGALGAILGGGPNRMDQYGLAVDDFPSINLVKADGQAATVTALSGLELWWALRGAEPSFGVVTSAVPKA
ncbi:FAD-binding domain-containing protein, partial [Glonium stellatum]